MTDESISTEAHEWVKGNSNILIDAIAGKYEDTQVGRVSVFMAGAPGAGKTEFSRCLLNDVFGADTKLIVRIDPDEIRLKIPMYIPGKAELFNRATIKGVDIIVDHCFNEKYNKSFLLDGTLSSPLVAKKNIDRALAHKRKVLIYYVYKDPIIAWDFTQKREKVEGRNIPKESFINHYFGSIETINTIKEEYGNKIQVDLVQLSVPNPNTPTITDYKFSLNITSVDGYIKTRYSKDQLMELL